MPTTSRVFVLLIKVTSKCTSIDDHRDQVALLATESPYTNLSATAVVGMPDGLVLHSNIGVSWLLERLP